MKLLIVDDEVDLCLLLKGFFARKGFDVELAYSRSAGMEALAKNCPDLLFLDNNLADGLGWPMIPEILRANPEMKVFLISAYHPPLPPIPANAYVRVIEKPISLAALDSMVSEFVQL